MTLSTMLPTARRLDPMHADWLIAAALGVALELQIWMVATQQARVVAAVVALAQVAAVAARRRWACQAIVLTAALTVAAALLYGGQATRGGGIVGAATAVLLLYGGGAYTAGASAWLSLASGLVLLSSIALSATDLTAANLLFDTVALGLLPWTIGRAARERHARERASRARAERLDCDRDSRVQAAALGERARLAREIHDVIAHSASVMVIQAAGARTVMDRDPALAERSLRSVERAGREALAEMRRLLGVLAEGHDPHALAPQPGLEDLPDLISRTRTAGLAASMQVEGDPSPVAPGLSLCVYRVVQEALTNTLKHAGPVRAEVALRWRADSIELDIVDDGEQTSAGAGATGHGIAGMRERAALHGGDVVAGPLPSGGFAVRARIPLSAGSAS